MEPLFLTFSSYIFQMMPSWILFGLFSLVHGQLDIPSLNENSRDNFGRRFPPTEAELQDILARLDFLGTERCSANVAAQWSYETDVNEYTQIQAVSMRNIHRHIVQFYLKFHPCVI